MQASVTDNWTKYVREHNLPGGGMAAYVSTPTGNYFASSGMPGGTDENTHFRIASNTKTFTAAAIMLLNQQGLLNIDDTIVSNIPGQSIPYVPTGAQYNIPYKSSITIRQLLSHTAGVFDVTNSDIPASCAQPYAGQNYVTYRTNSNATYQFTPDELVGVDADCQLSYFAPGTDYKYSNTGYSVLAIIIARVSGKTYDQFLIQNFITPLGLTNTSVPMLGTDQTPPTPYVPGYIWYSGTFQDTTVSDMSANIAEGNIISTPADLAKWIRALISGQAGLNAATVEMMKTPTALSGSNNYGLGLTTRPGLGYGHEGAHAGYLSLMDYDPTADVATVLYFNVWDYANMFTDQATLLRQGALDARAAVGY